METIYDEDFAGFEQFFPVAKELDTTQVDAVTESLIDAELNNLVVSILASKPKVIKVHLDEL